MNHPSHRRNRQYFSPYSVVLLFATLAMFAGAAAADPIPIIVELEGEPAAVWKARREQRGLQVSDDALAAARARLALDQDAVIARMRSAGIDFEVGTIDVPGPGGTVAATVAKRYTLVYNGFSVDVDPAQVGRIAAVEGVAATHPVEVLTGFLDQSVAFTKAPELYGGIPELTQFDDVREGFEGQGMIVSVIDTGIEWQHAMFGGDPTPPRLGVSPPTPALVADNPKVIYHLPLADLAVEDGFGHGTHVASTAAGYLGFSAGGDGLPMTLDDLPVHGVAPQAKLMSYIVCSTVGSTYFGTGLNPPNPAGLLFACLGDAILLAIEDSVSPRTLTGFAKPVAHVINMSLGAPFGSPDSPTAVAASNAALTGTIVVAAAGNSGSIRGVVGSPSAGTHVISVAATTDPGAVAEFFVDVQAPDGRTDMAIIPMLGTPAPPPGGTTGRYVYVDALTAADYPDVDGKIALIRNGEAVGAYAETANNAALSGATAALLISDADGANAIVSPIPAALIPAADAEHLIGYIGVTPQSGDVSNVEITLKAGRSVFRSDIAGFSSRGPVHGLGQIKPDIAAPGVNVLAAVPPASVIGAVSNTDQGLDYAQVSGTSMASPHAAGAATLIKQANPTWSPDMVRTALINTATQGRDKQGVPDSHGPHNPDIFSQGGGLIDVAAAANTRALMGVTGDGIERPGILGSHSFGGARVVGSQCTTEHRVTVTVRDLRGTGGSYALALHDNRGTTIAGVSTATGASQVTLPPGGETTVTVDAVLDGVALDDNQVHDLQWYLTADRAGGGERLSMPFYLFATPAIPALTGDTEVNTEVFTGTLEPGSTTDPQFGQQQADVAIEVPPGTFRLVAHLETPEPTNSQFPDLDLILFDPNGQRIDSSGRYGSVEDTDTEIFIPGTYTYRIINFQSVGTTYTLTVDSHNGSIDVAPATLAPIEGEYAEQSGAEIDFDGALTLSWTGYGGELAYRVEQSTNGGPWTQIDRVDASTTSLALSGLANGDYAFRVRSEFPGSVCTYVERPSNEVLVTVDHREQVVITSEVDADLTRASFQGGVFSIGMELTHIGAETWLNPVELAVVWISDPTVQVINADNGGSGRGSSPALFSYAALLGDEELAPGETSGVRTLDFADPESRLFTFEIEVTGYRRTP